MNDKQYEFDPEAVNDEIDRLAFDRRLGFRNLAFALAKYQYIKDAATIVVLTAKVAELKKTLREYEHESETINELRKERDAWLSQYDKLAKHLTDEQECTRRGMKQNEDLIIRESRERSMWQQHAKKLNDVLDKCHRLFSSQVDVPSSIQDKIHNDTSNALAEFEAFLKNNS